MKLFQLETEVTKIEQKVQEEFGFGTAEDNLLGRGTVQITLRWTGRNDLDLHVIDPTGAEIFWDNKQSASGGLLDVDSNHGCEKVDANPAENILLDS